MGRCGTSLTAAIIGLMGVYLDPTERVLLTNSEDNARGYWEQQEIYEINEEILGAFGGTWGHPLTYRLVGSTRLSWPPFETERKVRSRPCSAYASTAGHGRIHGLP